MSNEDDYHAYTIYNLYYNYYKLLFIFAVEKIDLERELK